MDFTNAIKILELDIVDDKFISLSEIEKKYRELIEKYANNQEKIGLINEAIEFIRNNYENIKMKYQIKSTDDSEKEIIQRAKENEERKIQKQEEIIRKEIFKHEEEEKKREKESQKIKREEEEKKKEELKKEEEDRIEKEKKKEENKIKSEKRKETIRKYKWYIGVITAIIILIPVYLYGNRSVTEYDKISGIKQTGKYKNFKRDGLWIIYYKDGSSEERYYKNGVLDKEIIIHDATGTSTKKINIVDGKKEGKYAEYDYDGNLMAEGFYKNDKLEGSFKKYNNNKLFLEGNYKNGILDGKFIVFSDNGEKIIDGLYKEGERDGEWVFNDLRELAKVKDLLLPFINEYFPPILKTNLSSDNYNLEGNIDISTIKISYRNDLKEIDLEIIGYYGEHEKINYKNGVETSYYNKFINLDGDEIISESYYENNKKKHRLTSNGVVILEENDWLEDVSGEKKTFYPKTGALEVLHEWKGGKKGKNGNITYYEKEVEKGFYETGELKYILDISTKKEKDEEITTLGTKKEFYKNGNLFMEGKLEGGATVDLGYMYNGRETYFSRKGVWKYFRKNGTLIMEANYEKSSDDSSRIYYYEDGKNVKIKLKYAGNGDYYWLFYDIEGNLEKRVDIFHKGDYIEYIIKFYENDTIVYEQKLRGYYTEDSITNLVTIPNIDSQNPEEVKVYDENDIKNSLKR